MEVYNNKSVYTLKGTDMDRYKLKEMCVFKHEIYLCVLVNVVISS